MYKKDREELSYKYLLEKKLTKKILSYESTLEILGSEHRVGAR